MEETSLFEHITAIGSTKTSSVGLSVAELSSVTLWSRARTIMLSSTFPQKRGLFISKT